MLFFLTVKKGVLYSTVHNNWQFFVFLREKLLVFLSNFCEKG